MNTQKNSKSGYPTRLSSFELLLILAVSAFIPYLLIPNIISKTQTVTVEKPETNTVVMLGNTNLADWQTLKTLDDDLIKENNIELNACNLPDVGNPNVTQTVQNKESAEYSYSVSNDEFVKEHQRIDFLKKLGYSPTQ